MINFIIGLIAIILIALVGFMFIPPEKKVEHKVSKKVEIKAVKPKVSKIEKKVSTIKSDNAESRQEDPENELENTNFEEKSTWHISDKEMDKNEKHAIKKHRKTRRSDGMIYENDDVKGIHMEDMSAKSSSSLSDESLLEMEEAHLSK